MVLPLSCVLEIPRPPPPPLPASFSLPLFASLLVSNSNNQEQRRKSKTPFFNEVLVINVNQIVIFLVILFSEFAKMMYSIA